MANKRQWTVRVINPVKSHPGMENNVLHPALDGSWVESMRYAGYLNVLRAYDGAEGYEVLELLCPNPTKYDVKVWADQNAARMQSFGINAAAAPKWEGGNHEALLAGRR